MQIADFEVYVMNKNGEKLVIDSELSLHNALRDRVEFDIQFRRPSVIFYGQVKVNTMCQNPMFVDA